MKTPPLPPVMAAAAAAADAVVECADGDGRPIAADSKWDDEKKEWGRRA